MTTHHHDPTCDDASMPPDLRLQLRALRRDLPPNRDLWPDIAARLDAPTAAATPVRAAAHRRAPAWFAMAASVCALVALGWQAWPTRPGAVAPTASVATPRIGPAQQAPLLREADAMTREYDAALLEMHQAGAHAYPAEAFAELERSAREIRAALARNPDSRFLLDRLQRVHAHRLALVERVA
jgi:hypothetical protein